MASVVGKRARLRRRRHAVRRKVAGDVERPRLTVYRSLSHTYAQIVDDVEGRTLVAVSTRSKELREALETGGNCAAAAKVGERIAAKAKEAGIEAVCFDRGGRKYHGRVKALAEAARKGGLKF